MWEDEGLKVLDPWTPIEVSRRAEDYDLSVWGRTYAVHSALLPTAIESQGRPMLAAPMRMNAVLGGKPVAWQRSGTRLMRREDGVVVVCGWQAVEDLYLNTVMRLEYDGTMRVDLTMTPVTGRKPSVEQLWLEIPFAPEAAKLYHYWPQKVCNGIEQPPDASNSGSVGAPVALSFRPMVWLGDEKAGVEWFAESPQRWQIGDPERAIEILPGPDETVLRVHLIDGEFRPWQGKRDGWGDAVLPWTVTFGLQATPVKDMNRAQGQATNCRLWNCCHMNSSNPGGGDVFLHEMAVEPGSTETVLDRLSARGVRTVVVHEAWNSVQNYFNVDYAYADKLKEMIRAFHDRGIRVLPYFGYELSPLSPDWAENFEEGLVGTVGGGCTGGYIREPAQRDYIVCLASRWGARWEKGVEDAMAQFGFDGVYLDGTLIPWGCANARHGCGYTDEQGQRQITYPLFAVRRVMRDMYAFIHDHGGYINPHQSSCCFTPALGFCDSYWNGEHIQTRLTQDILATLSLDSFRAEFMGDNFGIHSEFLVYPKPPYWTWDNALALCLPHGVLPRPSGVTNGMLDSMAPLWQTREDFGVTRAAWHPYWENGALVRADHPGVYASFYALDRGQGMELLLLVSHIADGDAPAVTVDLSGWAAAGHSLPTAARAVTGGPVRLCDGKLTLDFTRFSSAVVWLS